jgi:hypothetical protein
MIAWPLVSLGSQSSLRRSALLLDPIVDHLPEKVGNYTLTAILVQLTAAISSKMAK